MTKVTDEMILAGCDVFFETKSASVEHMVEQVFLAMQSASPHPDTDFQTGVDKWMDACFGDEIKADQLERADRFIEEALELVQTMPNFTADRAHALVDYVFGRSVGERHQEVGGVMVTLAALCNTVGIRMDEAAANELLRVWTKVEQIRAKQAAKPTGSALPVPHPDTVDREEERKWEIIRAYCAGARDAHENYEEDRDPDFTEAGLDYFAALASESPDSGWRDIATAPKDGTLLLLLVDYSDGDHWIDDEQSGLGRTIGHNNDDNVGKGEGAGWQFAGWCWTHDHYVEGKGRVVGWQPFPALKGGCHD